MAVFLQKTVRTARHIDPRKTMHSSRRTAACEMTKSGLFESKSTGPFLEICRTRWQFSHLISSVRRQSGLGSGDS